MPWFGYVLLGLSNLIAVIALTFCAHVVKSLGKIEGQVAKQQEIIGMLVQWQHDKDHQCDDRLIWLRNVDSKLDDQGQKVSEIHGWLKAQR